MTLEQQVCSLELAKKLKKLGVKQESYFLWHSAVEGFEKVEYAGMVGSYPGIQTYSAFTVAELGEMLPTLTRSGNTLRSSENERFNCDVWLSSNPEVKHNELAPTEADARAKMLIYLVENKLI